MPCRGPILPATCALQTCSASSTLWEQRFGNGRCRTTRKRLPQPMRILCWLANKMPHKPEHGSARFQLLLLPCTMVLQGMAAPSLFLSLSERLHVDI